MPMDINMSVEYVPVTKWEKTINKPLFEDMIFLGRAVLVTNRNGSRIYQSAVKKHQSEASTASWRLVCYLIN